MELRDLPSVDAIIASCGETVVPASIVADVARVSVEQARAALVEGADTTDPAVNAREIIATIARARPIEVINATGVLLHTNLGRAPMPSVAVEAASSVASGYSNVEIDVNTGRRAGRHDYLAPVIASVTGAEAGFAVNNNAGALLLALAALGPAGGKVAVSRGELIEIGGSFRLPDLMRSSGVELVEVGTTNRTRLDDYRSVLSTVDSILKVHPSNYRIDGFQEEATWGELAELAHGAGIPFIADVGSGLIDEAAPWVPQDLSRWLRDEPGVRQVVELGADLVLFSGDKLLGGPQAGIIAGRAEAVAVAKKHPIARAVRLDGPAIASLSVTIEAYADNRVRDIPFWQMATTSVDALAHRAKLLMEGASGAEAVESHAVPGAGSVPGATIPSVAVRLPGSADKTWSRLAGFEIPVIATRRDGATMVDLRSVPPRLDSLLGRAIAEACS